ncbi:MAG: hypothetical protein A2W03_11660 [Candidatus Aminicenantes bacterium RBG_16_63_16]|nr:MAG: hypothetical protein A2W03_11660 [Candidatus Aminicenantes bacterium RBG_16_63_16]
MRPDNNKGDILSTWKEIAAYLKSGVRTCLRWEKENGLPVHRQEGAPRSRIFAYKNELDAWFESRLGNGSIQPEPVPGPRRFWRSPFLLVPLGLLGVAAGLFIISRPRPAIPAKPAASGVPASAGVLLIVPGDLVETEFAGYGRLRLWRQQNDATLFEVWRIEPGRHSSLAVGDLDGEPGHEIAAPGYCREFEKAGDYTTSKIRFFINAYKHGFKDWWKTTFYDVSQCFFEKDNFESVETLIADIDGLPGNEILTVTAHSLAAFKFNPEAGELRMIWSQASFIPNTNLLMRSAAVGDVDADGKNEILATAAEGEEGAETPDRGWLLVLRWQDGRPQVVQIETLPGSTSARGLKIGNVIPGGTEEAIIACYRTKSGTRYGSIVGWASGRGFLFEKLIDEVGGEPFGGLSLAVGDLSPKPGDEVLVARNNPPEIISLFWQNQRLLPGPKYGLDAYARVNNVQIGPPRIPGAYSSVLVSGTGEWAGQAGRSYLELIQFGDGFIPQWVRTGGEKEDLRVSQAALIH